MSNGVEIDLNLNADEAIKKLEKIKSLLEDIKKLDNNFSLSNIIEVKDNTILLFYADMFLKQKDIKKIATMLTDTLNTKCILLDRISFEKALDFGIDKSKERDYTTTIYYDSQENILKEEIT